jgi:hypothetical protein
LSCNKFTVNSNQLEFNSKAFKLNSLGSPFSIKSGGFSVISTKDLNLQTLNNFNLNASELNITGIKPTGSKVIVSLNTPKSLFQVSLNGNFIIDISPKLTETPFNPAEGLSATRTSLSSFVMDNTGNITFYNKSKAQIQLLSIPKPGTGVNLSNVSLQHAVLGDNLVSMLNDILNELTILINQFLANSPAFGICAVGNVALSPTIITALTNTITKIKLFQTQYTSAPTPTSILSAKVLLT